MNNFKDTEGCFTELSSNGLSGYDNKVVLQTLTYNTSANTIDFAVVNYSAILNLLNSGGGTTLYDVPIKFARLSGGNVWFYFTADSSKLPIIKY